MPRLLVFLRCLIYFVIEAKAALIRGTTGNRPQAQISWNVL